MVAHLQDRGAHTHVVDVPPGTGTRVHAWDRYTRHDVPPIGDPAREAELSRLTARHGIDLVVPTVPDELVDISSAAASFAPGVDIVVSATAGLVHARDALHALRRLARAGVPTVRVAAPGDYGDDLGPHDLPRERLVLVPRSAWLADQAVPLFDPRALDLSVLGNAFYVTSRPTGPEWRVLIPGLHQDEDLDGVVAALGPVRSDTGRAVPRRPEILEVARAAVRTLGITGPVQVLVAEDERSLRVTSVAPGITRAFAKTPFLLDIALGLGARR